MIAPTPPTETQLALTLLDLAPRVTGTLGRALIEDGRLRVEVTDPAALDRLRATYGMARHSTFTGSYVGLIGGVQVTVALVIPRGIIAPQQRRAS